LSKFSAYCNRIFITLSGNVVRGGNGKFGLLGTDIVGPVLMLGNQAPRFSAYGTAARFGRDNLGGTVDVTAGAWIDY